MRNRILILSAFSIIAVLFFILESFLPKPIPFFRLGIANVFILLILVKMDFFSALIVLLSKVILGNLFSGLLFTPIFLLSLLSSVMALAAMYIALKSRIGFSLIGISVSGAVLHNLTQLVVVYFVLIKNTKVFYLIPVMLLLALLMGIITGAIAIMLYKRVPFGYIYERN